MRTLALLLLTLFSALSLHAGTFDLAEECERVPDVNIVSIDQSMLRLASFPSSDSPIDLDAIAHKLDKVQIITTDNKENMESVNQIARRYLNSSPKFKRTMRMKDDNEIVELYTRSLDKDHNEFLLIVQDNVDLTVVLLSGTITMQEIGQFTNF